MEVRKPDEFCGTCGNQKFITGPYPNFCKFHDRLIDMENEFNIGCENYTDQFLKVKPKGR
jgi:hypothetical protein